MSARRYTLADVTDLLTDGTHYTPPNVGVGVPFLTVKDVSDAGLDFINCSRISQAEFENAQKQNSAPKIGDVLFSKDGTVGKVHLVREPQDFAVLSSLAILRPDKRLASEYLAHFLRSPTALDAAMKKKTGSAVRRIVLRDLASLQIPLPPIDEQKRIAAILDKADALRAKRRQAIALLDSYTQSIFLEMFGDADKIPRLQLGEFCTVKGGKRLPKGHDYIDLDEGHYYLRVSDFQKEKLTKRSLKRISKATHDQIRRYTVSAGDLAISIAGTIGETIVISPELNGVNLTENAAKISITNNQVANPFYLKTALSMPQARAQIAASTGQVTIGKLALFRIEQLEVPLPQIEHQTIFARVNSQLERQRQKCLVSAEVSETLFASLQHRAFTGQL